MVKCPECRWNYPSNTYVSAMMVNGRYTPPICGICALEMGNRLHGLPRSSFGGEMAEEMRQKAIRWRQNNPKYGPPNEQG
jgi:hypothetical protein